MVELCGAAGRRRARSTSAFRAGAGAARSCCARRACRRSSAWRWRRSARPRSCSALDFASEPAAGRARGERAGAAPRRRHARGRPDRGGRADRRPRAAARDAARAAWRRRQAHARPARAPRGRGRARRPRPARDRRLELRRAGAARPPAARGRPPAARVPWRSRTRSPRSSRSCARHCSARCSTPPRHNVARNGPDMAIFESGTVYRPAAHRPARRTSRAGARAPRARRAPERRPRAARLARRAGRGGLLRGEGAARRRCSTTSHVELGWCVARTWPFLHPGRSAAVLAGEQPLGCPRRGPPARRRSLGPAAHGGVRRRPRQARRGRARGRVLPRLSRRCRRCARTLP